MSRIVDYVDGTNCTRGQTDTVTWTDHDGGQSTYVCNCGAPYYGDNCESRGALWGPMLLARNVVMTVFGTILLYWAIVKIIQLSRDHKLKKNLSTVALFFVAISLVMHIIYNWLPGSYEAYSPANEAPARIANTIFYNIPLALWMSSNELIIGFWFDVLTKKMQATLARRTKITAIAASVVLAVASAVGLIFNYIGQPLIGSVIAVIPLAINCFLMLLATSYLGCCFNDKEMPLINLKKKRYAVRLFAVSVATWFCFFIMVIFLALGKALPREVTPIIFFLIDIVYIVISLCILLLVDRHGGPFRLTKILILKRRLLDERGASADASSSNSTAGTRTSHLSSTVPTLASSIDYATHSKFTYELEASEEMEAGEENLTKSKQKSISSGASASERITTPSESSVTSTSEETSNSS